jgi:hypothetical protein
MLAASGCHWARMPPKYGLVPAAWTVVMSSIGHWEVRFDTVTHHT